MRCATPVTANASHSAVRDIAAHADGQALQDGGRWARGDRVRNGIRDALAQALDRSPRRDRQPPRLVIACDVARRIDALGEERQLAILGAGIREAVPATQPRREAPAFARRGFLPGLVPREAHTLWPGPRRRCLDHIQVEIGPVFPFERRRRHATGECDHLAVARTGPGGREPERREQLRPGEAGEHGGRCGWRRAASRPRTATAATSSPRHSAGSACTAAAPAQNASANRIIVCRP